MSTNFPTPFQGNSASGSNNSNFSVFKPYTDGCSIFSGDMMMRVSYYDTTMKIEFRQRNSEGKFPKPAVENEIAVILNCEQVVQIVNCLDKFFIPALERYMDDIRAGRDCSNQIFSFAVPIYTKTTSKAFEISTGKATPNGYLPEFKLHINVGEDRKPEKTFVFKTSAAKILITNGKGLDADDIIINEDYPQFVLMVNIFHSFVENIGKAALHCSKTKASENLAHMGDVIDRIAMQLNVPVKQQYQNSGYNRSQNQATQLNNVSIAPQQAELGDIIGNTMPW